MPRTDLFLPDYTVRVSPRAKRLQLRVKPTGQIEVVVPRGVALRHVPEFVAEHTQWLKQTVTKTLERLEHQPQDNTPTLPARIALMATGGEWQVSYHPALRARIVEQSSPARLQLFGSSKTQQYAALQGWLNQLAKATLIPWLEAVSREVNLPFSSATVRAQKSRWGSCSSRKRISLNRALMFVSPGAVRYLFIHELCHTIHMNHSARFWALVATLEPDHRRYEAELRHAMASIPHWALPG